MEYPFFDYFYHRLDRLTGNVKLIESSLEEDENGYVQRHQALTDLAQRGEGLTENEQISADFFHDDIALYDESMQLYRQSSFLMLFAFLEDSLQKICTLLRTQFNYTLAPDDLHGKGVLRLKLYLEKVAFMTFDESLTEKVDQYRLIRNHLAHEFGEVKESAKKIRGIASSSIPLSLDDWGYTEFLRLEDGFLDEFAAIIQQLFSSIEKQTKQKLTVRLVTPAQ